MDQVKFFVTQDEFSNWLEVNFSTEKKVWLGYYKKKTKIDGMTWSDSVDVALCYGWIDGIRKSIDEQSYKIRFTPRKIKSVWSAVNVKKVNTLINEKRMTPNGLYLFNERNDKMGYTSKQREVKLSVEYEDQIKLNKEAWLFYNDLAPSYKRDSIWWIMSAKKEETRLKRVKVLIESSQQGLKIPKLFFLKTVN